MISPNFKVKPGYIDGYHKETQEVHKLKKRFVDKEFDTDVFKYYQLADPTIAYENEITPDTIKFLELSNIVPSIYFNHDIHLEERIKK